MTNIDILFQCTGIIILLSFYGIYFIKMALQRRKGIRTDQIARGEKSKNLWITEVVMKIATFAIVVVELASILLNTGSHHNALRVTGAVFGIVGVTLFGIAVYTMKDSWRAGIPETDKTELVTTGIFKFSRNPAFLAFDLVYIAILLMFFNWMLLTVSLFCIIMLHLQIKQEEQFLLRTFGEKYANYKKKTRRYI